MNLPLLVRCLFENVHYGTNIREPEPIAAAEQVLAWVASWWQSWLRRQTNTYALNFILFSNYLHPVAVHPLPQLLKGSSKLHHDVLPPAGLWSVQWYLCEFTIDVADLSPHFWPEIGFCLPPSWTLTSRCLTDSVRDWMTGACHVFFSTSVALTVPKRYSILPDTLVSKASS